VVVLKHKLPLPLIFLGALVAFLCYFSYIAASVIALSTVQYFGVSVPQDQLMIVVFTFFILFVGVMFYIIDRVFLHKYIFRRAGW
jgi:hypothetical protein